MGSRHKDGSFKPKDTLTRAEAASLLSRIKS
ncbi:S-layer homology domain-containing protein [Paenibacillus sp. LHD-38]